MEENIVMTLVALFVIVFLSMTPRLKSVRHYGKVLFSAKADIFLVTAPVVGVVVSEEFLRTARIKICYMGGGRIYVFESGNPPAGPIPDDVKTTFSCFFGTLRIQTGDIIFRIDEQKHSPAVPVETMFKKLLSLSPSDLNLVNTAV